LKKKALWQDIRKSFSGSWGRFFSIMGLMLLGSFALVGLYVTGPDMRATGTTYFNQHHTADVSVIADYGLDKSDVQTIKQAKGVQDAEFGYLKDVAIQGTDTSVRIFSAPTKVSQYQVVKGRMPRQADEIVLNAKQEQAYKLGQQFKVTEKADALGNTVLKRHTFKVVGFVNSAELISDVNMGQSTSGSGSLKGFGVVTKQAFRSDYYMLARLTFKNTQGVDPYSSQYTQLLDTHKDQLKTLLKNQPQKRLAAIKKQANAKIASGQKKIDAAKQKLIDTQNQLASAKTQIAQANQQISANQEKLNTQVTSAQSQISAGEKQIQTSQTTLAASTDQLNAAKAQLDNGQTTLNQKWTQLQTAKTALAQTQTQLASAKQQLATAAQAIDEGQSQIAAGYKQIDANQAKINDAQAQITASAQTLAQQKALLDAKETEYQANAQTLATKQAQWDAANTTLNEKQAALTKQQSTLTAGKTQYTTGISQLQAQIGQLNQQLANTQLTDAERAQLTGQLQAAQQKLTETQSAYQTFMQEKYTPGMAQIAQAQDQIDASAKELAATKTQLAQSAQQLQAARSQLDASQAKYAAAAQELTAAQTKLQDNIQALAAAKAKLAASEKLLAAKKQEYQAGLIQYNQGVQAYNSGQHQYRGGLQTWLAATDTLSQKSAAYQQNAAKIAQARTELQSKVNQLATAKSTLATQQATGEQQLAAAKRELSTKEKQYQDSLAKFNDAKPAAEKKIATAEATLKEAKATLKHLQAPVYARDSRREVPWGDGYKIYGTISWIVDSLAAIFPIFLYFVAALVTITTMTRFVDEERINSGTLKALGYDNRDVIKKFTIYGFAASMVGTVLGVILGHTLLPYIVYNAYSTGFTLPRIQFHIHWGVTLIAFALALLSAVVPAYYVAMRELRDKPAALLLPKPPAAGSKIFLERITVIWKHLSFTHKVTARNIFRYKKRMFMTIFGVAGSVALLFTGLAVQHSIAGINDRQFGDLVHYDMIVAHTDYVPTSQQNKINKLLDETAVKEHTKVHYEQLTRVAGKSGDTQQIKLIVPSNTQSFTDYIQLVNRRSQQKLTLKKSGVVISERLANLLGAKVGDTITLRDANNTPRRMKVTGITEMYMGHFAFMSPQAYARTFDTSFSTNADLINLQDRSTSNTRQQSAKFMKLSGVAGVVQNTTLRSQINVIVNSLDKIMMVLIVIAGLLAVVILYNLTNINVSERMRELSTIKVLGFYNNEVTMYIYRETIILSLFGIAAGYVLGELLHRYILWAVPPDEVMFNPALGAMGFIIPFIVVAIITLLLGFFVNHRLKNVDMLEALKSVD
jgi:putative ABC transport system permease protein